MLTYRAPEQSRTEGFYVVGGRSQCNTSISSSQAAFPLWLGLSVSTENILENSRVPDDPSLMALPAPNQGLMTSHPSLLPSTMASKSS